MKVTLLTAFAGSRRKWPSLTLSHALSASGLYARYVQGSSIVSFRIYIVDVKITMNVKSDTMYALQILRFGEDFDSSVCGALLECLKVVLSGREVSEGKTGDSSCPLADEVAFSSDFSSNSVEDIIDG